MRRLVPALTLALAALAAVSYFSVFRTLPGTPVPSGDDAYTRYRGDTPPLEVAFDTPKDWRLIEDTGKIDVYTQVMAIGPRNADDTYSTTLVVRGAPLRSNGGRFESAAAAARFQETHLYAGAKLLKKTAAMVSGLKGLDLTIRYTMPPLRHKGLVAKEVPMKVRTIVVQGKRNLYELIYSADEREFDRHAAAFERLAATFSAARP